MHWYISNPVTHTVVPNLSTQLSYTYWAWKKQTRERANGTQEVNWSAANFTEGYTYTLGLQIAPGKTDDQRFVVAEVIEHEAGSFHQALGEALQWDIWLWDDKFNER